MLPPAVTALPVLRVEGAAPVDFAAPARCLEPLADKLALPAPKERDTLFATTTAIVQARSPRTPGP
jgi:hypothetical protein